MNVLTVDFNSQSDFSTDSKSCTEGISKALDQSLRETGFAVIRNHPISKSLLDDFYEEWKQFFASPTKFDSLFDRELQSGFFPFRSENAKGYAQKDLKEFFHLFPNTPFPQGIGKSTLLLRAQLQELAVRLLGWIQLVLPPEIRDRLSMPLPEMIRESEGTLLRILHYPPMGSDIEAGAVRAAPHEDINLITLLPAATRPGLQVKNLSGEWQEVPCDPGTIVINVGDMLHLATDGYYPSTTHQVVNPQGADVGSSRFSSPFFLHPRSEVVLKDGITAGQYLTQRLKEIGLK